MPKTKPTVWFVDDLQANLDAFQAAHSTAFDIRTFTSIDDVRDALKKEEPDAMLCDVYFYESPERAKAVEKEVQQAAEQIRKTAKRIDADMDKHLSGIDLMEYINKKFHHCTPFPVYAYTSKGPYLLGTSQLDRIENANAKLFLKGRYSPDVERTRLKDDIEESRLSKSWSAWVARRISLVLSVCGVAGWLAGKGLELLWAYAFN
ncbi:MAG: hypothetical protein H6810_08630 [Phycisphaeraceae bacterium]|nr:MAG: hypothetical protein H6810_08630 [Phycisphaeraceae bacterium]